METRRSNTATEKLRRARRCTIMDKRQTRASRNGVLRTIATFPGHNSFQGRPQGCEVCLTCCCAGILIFKERQCLRIISCESHVLVHNSLHSLPQQSNAILQVAVAVRLRSATYVTNSSDASLQRSCTYGEGKKTSWAVADLTINYLRFGASYVTQEFLSPSLKGCFIHHLTTPSKFGSNANAHIMTVSQPLPIDAPHMCCSRINEKYAQHCHHYEPTSFDDGIPYEHGDCHRRRLRRVLNPILLGLLAAFLLLCVIYAVRITYIAGMDREAGAREDGWLGMLNNGFKIVKRAVESTGNSDSFVHNKRTYTSWSISHRC